MAKAPLIEAIVRRGIATYLQQMQARGDDCLPMWDRVIAAFHDMEAQVLEAEGRAPGWHNKYERLQPKYEAWKRRNFPGRRILELTGALYEHLTRNPAPNCWYVKDRTRLTILPGLKLPNHPGDLIAVHQCGRSGLGARQVTFSTGEAGDWEEGVSSTFTANVKVTPKMDARPPVRLTRRGVQRIGTAAISWVCSGISQAGEKPT